jgi:FixJ family two-component response regulator
MGPSDMLAQQIMSERGLILCAGRETIRGALDALGSPLEHDHLLRQLDYLEEEHLVRVETRRAMGVRRVLYEITSRGRDVLHGIVEHPGINIPEVSGD